MENIIRNPKIPHFTLPGNTSSESFRSFGSVTHCSAHASLRMASKAKSRSAFRKSPAKPGELGRGDGIPLAEHVIPLAVFVKILVQTWIFHGHGSEKSWAFGKGFFFGILDAGFQSSTLGKGMTDSLIFKQQSRPP